MLPIFRRDCNPRFCVVTPVMLRSELVKIATNAWTQRLLDGRLSHSALEDLVDGGVLADKPVKDIHPRATGGKGQWGSMRMPQKYTTHTTPLQSPGMALPFREHRTNKALWDLENWRKVMHGLKPESVGVSVIPGGYQDASFTANRQMPGGRINIPKRHWSDFPGVRRNTIAHELGHAQDYVTGAYARGFYDLKDRLLFHKLEKRAPGILLNQSFTAPPTMFLDEALAQSRGYHAVHPRRSESAMLNNVLSHLRNNYSAHAPYTGNQTLGKARTWMHGAPLEAQTKLIEPLRGTVGGGLSRALKLLSKLRR